MKAKVVLFIKKKKKNDLKNNNNGCVTIRIHFVFIFYFFFLLIPIQKIMNTFRFISFQRETYLWFLIILSIEYTKLS